MIEFELGGETYRADKLSCFAQLHVSRKLAPILPKLLPAIGVFQGRTVDEMLAMAGNMDVIGTALGPLADAFAAMPTEDVDAICTTCMDVVRRRQPASDTWAPVVARGRVMFQDIDLGVMLPMIVHVVRDSLGNFIAGFLSKKSDGDPEAQQAG